MIGRVPVWMRVLAMTVVVMRGFVMWGCLVVKAQEVRAKVVAVGRMDDGMGVKFLRLGIVEHHPFLMVEFDSHHGAFDPVIKSTLVSTDRQPSEKRMSEMPLDIAHPGRKQARKVASTNSTG